MAKDSAVSGTATGPAPRGWGAHVPSRFSAELLLSVKGKALEAGSVEIAAAAAAACEETGSTVAV
jgi:hypothetical protein